MSSKFFRTIASLLTAFTLVASAPAGLLADDRGGPGWDPDSADTATPIKHVVVIFGENISFDHYFATYPSTLNTTVGEPAFTPKTDTPTVNNLANAGLLTTNPNAALPFRLSRAEAVTCDQNHNYLQEQQAVDNGLNDQFVRFVGTGNSGTIGTTSYCFDYGHGTNLTMGYYDGNTVTALWNYAQYFAMSDNSWSTTFGPSAPGAINLVSGNTYEFETKTKPNGAAASPSGVIWGGKQSTPATSGSLIGDARPFLDDCVNSNPGLLTTNTAEAVATGDPQNVGDLMGDLGFPNPKHEISWGWFQGGFGPTTAYNPPTVPFAVCGSAGTGLAGNGVTVEPDNVTTVGDYIPHHEPFEFYASSTNQHHLPPSKEKLIGWTDQANHQYDLSAFTTALQKGNLPAVTYLKAKAYQDAHAAYSDPIDEQTFVVNTVNAIMNSQYWQDTAIFILYDDSDGWYDHQPSPIVNTSGKAGNLDDSLSPVAGSLNVQTVGAPTGLCVNVIPGEGIEGRCGYGMRQPLIVISPYAKTNYVDHSLTDQASVLKFIEDNWHLGRLGNGSSDAKAGSLLNMFDFNRSFDDGHGHHDDHRLILNSSTGEVMSTSSW